MRLANSVYAQHALVKAFNASTVDQQIWLAAELEASLDRIMTSSEWEGFGAGRYEEHGALGVEGGLATRWRCPRTPPSILMHACMHACVAHAGNSSFVLQRAVSVLHRPSMEGVIARIVASCGCVAEGGQREPAGQAWRGPPAGSEEGGGGVKLVPGR